MIVEAGLADGNNARMLCQLAQTLPFRLVVLARVLWMQRHGSVYLRLLFRQGDGGFGVFEIAADVHDSAKGECTRQYLVIIVGEGRVHDVAVGVHEIVHDAPQLIVVPDGISAFSTLSTSSALSSSVAAVRIIPWLRVPRIFFGARLAMMTSFLPMSAAGSS